jgi:hypothetical protein
MRWQLNRVCDEMCGKIAAARQEVRTEGEKSSKISLGDELSPSSKNNKCDMMNTED